MARFLSPIFASSTKTIAEKSGTLTLKSRPGSTAFRDSRRKSKPDFTCSLASKTTPNCAAFSTPRKSARGSLPYENPPHPHGSAPVFRLYGGGVSFPLPCGHAFRVFHVPTVPAVHKDQTG